MSFQQHGNFGYGTVATAPSPAASGTSMVLTAGQGTRFPDPDLGQYNIMIWPAGANPLPTNAEICTAQDLNTDTFSLVRAQEGSSARTIVVGDQVAVVISKKIFTDIENSISAPPNLVKNGNFINNSTNGYGGTSDDWTNSSGNPVQGGMPVWTKQNLIDLLGIADGDIEGLWPLNGFVSTDDFDDLSANAYDLDSATHVPGTSSDGLFGTALDFESGSSQYGSATAANTNVTGAQTLFCFFKPESIAQMTLLGLGQNATGERTLALNSSGKVVFTITGLTTNATITSDVILEAGKWYFIVGTYDSSNSLLKVWVNGIKKQVTASGSGTALTNGFAIGRRNGYADRYADGLLQNCGHLSITLSDTRVKKLWAATTYRGMKIRRATSDGYIYQELSEDLVERLRGKKVVLAAELAQDTSSIAQLEINDGSSSTSSVFTTTNTFTDTQVAATISATATSIQLRIKAITSDGNVWVRKVRFYEAEGTSGHIVPFNHSQDDRVRFPRLLNLNPPLMAGGSPYKYEENKWHTYTPTGVNNCTHSGRFIFSGNICHAMTKLVLSGAPGFSTTVMPTLPILASQNETFGDNTNIGYGGYEDSGTANKINSLAANISAAGTNLLWIFVTNGAILSNTNPITWANNDKIVMRYTFEID